MIGFALLALGFTVTLSIVAWRFGRPAIWIFPSDTFFLMSVILVGIVPFTNVNAQSPFAVNYDYADEAVTRALFGLSLMFFAFSVVWFFRPKIRFSIVDMSLNDSSERGKYIVVMATLAITAMLMMFPRFIEYKIDILKIMTRGVSGDEYQQLRRIAYAGDPLIEGVVGRLRYSVFAFLFTMTAIFCFQKLKPLVFFPFLVLLFLGLPSSVSKLTIVVFVAYATIAFMLVRRRYKFLLARRFLFAAFSGLFAIVILLAAIYFLQYPEQFKGMEDAGAAIQLAIFRVYTATYVALLQFFTVYPNVFEHSYFRESSLIANIFGEVPRNLDTEVPTYFLGEARGKLTTFPTIFIGSAYASAGYIGIAVYSLIVAIIAYLNDYVLTILRSGIVRMTYYSTMLVNMVFFSIIAAPTTLLTYGGAVIPVVALIVDRVLFSARRYSTPRGFGYQRRVISKVPLRRVRKVDRQT